MHINRRQWLATATATVAAPFGLALRALAQEPAAARVERIARAIGEYERQGFHRTGTAVDRASGEWLAAQVRQAGLAPALEPFALNRIDPTIGALIVGDRRIEGVPLFDGGFTGADGVRGRLGRLGADAEVALGETPVNAAGGGPLGDARRANRHTAIVAITRGRRPGLCPSNADAFLQPFGPPVLQVSSEEAAWLGEQATRGAGVQVIAQVVRTLLTATNVTATIDGTSRELPPFIVMTPRSGWYWCASERGGGIACWLEAMRALRAAGLKRSVVFVASSGHELGHLGINAFIDRRPGIVTKAAGWLHLGANIGAATEPANTIQSSDDEFEAMLARAMSSSGLKVNRRNPRGTIPGGEAEAVHRGGGRYVSVIGGNALFHNPDDRGPQAIDPAAIAKFTDAFVAVVRSMAA